METQQCVVDAEVGEFHSFLIVSITEFCFMVTNRIIAGKGP